MLLSLIFPMLLLAKPNIVLMTVDDLDEATFDLALANGLMPAVKTAMIDHGTRFSNSFVVDSLCCPSRATTLSGQYAHNHNVHGNLPPQGSITAFDNANTLAMWLQAAGYRTAFVGKYLNGYGQFTSQTYVPPGWTDWQGLIDPSTYTAYDHMWNDNGTVVDDRANGTVWWNYNLDMTTLRARRPIKAVDPRPLFLWLSPVAPHFWWQSRDRPVPHNECPGPGEFGGNIYGFSLTAAPRYAGTVSLPLSQGPSFNESDVSDKPPWIQQNVPSMTTTDVNCLTLRQDRRLESLRSLDDQFWQVETWLNEAGLWANTIVIFTSDNGYMLGEHRLSEKVAAYEPSIRVPLVIRRPADLTSFTEPRLVGNIDLAPTIAKMAGATPERIVDGRSLVAVLAHASTPYWRRLLLIESYQAGVDAPGSTYPLPPEFFGLRVTASSSGMPAPRLYTHFTADAFEELYDLTVDAAELSNAAAARQGEIQQLTSVLNAMKTCAGLNCRAIEASFSFTP